ncbi:hypothetical protein G6L30_07925 [Agrobacterium rhizogenes]|nr:hypothetical protein [Rhizobium rhizogenes]
MSRPYGIFRATCAHPGCADFARYEADNRKHYIELERSYGFGKYRCVRHANPDVVLSSENNRTIAELTVFEQPHGLYWGKDKAQGGFEYGLGYKAFAEDFPPGTILRVTAEVILPAAKEPSQ